MIFMRTLREQDYFLAGEEMHYALLQTADKIAPFLHDHEFFEIFLVIEGAIEHHVNAEQIVLSHGSLTFIRPADAHRCRPVPGVECHIINLAVPRRTIRELLNYLGDGFQPQQLLEPPLPPTVILTAAGTAQVRRRLERVNTIPMDRTPERKTALRMLLFDFVTQYFSLSLHEYEVPLPGWLQNACRAMQQPENLAGGVRRMVALAAVTPEHLARTMQKHLGLTPTAYINRQRLDVAANLLAHGDGRIVDIASDVGFESLSYFYTLFKRRFGLTPRQFRRHNQSRMLGAP